MHYSLNAQPLQLALRGYAGHFISGVETPNLCCVFYGKVLKTLMTTDHHIAFALRAIDNFLLNFVYAVLVRVLASEQ